MKLIKVSNPQVSLSLMDIRNRAYTLNMQYSNIPLHGSACNPQGPVAGTDNLIKLPIAMHNRSKLSRSVKHNRKYKAFAIQQATCDCQRKGETVDDSSSSLSFHCTSRHFFIYFFSTQFNRVFLGRLFHYSSLSLLLASFMSTYRLR